jgi:hypothetical protein
MGWGRLGEVPVRIASMHGGVAHRSVEAATQGKVHSRGGGDSRQGQDNAGRQHCDDIRCGAMICEGGDPKSAEQDTQDEVIIEASIVAISGWVCWIGAS